MQSRAGDAGRLNPPASGLLNPELRNSDGEICYVEDVPLVSRTKDTHGEMDGFRFMPSLEAFVQQLGRFRRVPEPLVLVYDGRNDWLKSPTTAIRKRLID